MTDAPLTPEEEAQALAAELALGLLDADEARAAEARMRDDASFAAMVRAWDERLAAMTDRLTPVMPSAGSRLRIHRALGLTSEPLSDVPAIRKGRGRRGEGSGGWTGWWLGAAVAGLLALAVVLLPGRDGAEYAADLSSEAGELRVEAQLQGRDLDIALAEGGATEGRDLELWWIEGDSAPVSLGVLPREGGASITLPEGLAPGESVQLALSDEPLGGSTTGQPTGAVVAIGPLTRL